MGYPSFAVLLVLLISCASIALGSSCTDACNASYARGINVTFCSLTGETFTTNVAAINQNGVQSGCYAKCGVGILHVGQCGCPNDCFSQEGHGACSASKCVCNAGWGGADCSIVKCPSSCSGHGTCVSQSNSKSGDICQCEKGWTAHDCSVAIPSFFDDHPYGSLNFGEIDGPAYYAKDKFYDTHPYFNYSTIATVKITIPDADLVYLLKPDTVYDVKYVPAKMYFYNGEISKALDVQFRTKGFSSRMNAKKSFNVKFSKEKDVKGLSLKANSGDRQVSSQVLWDVYRSQKIQTYRHAHAQLYINNLFHGLVSLEERLDDAWMESRYKVDDKKEANMYKIGPYALNYLGDTAEDYQNYRTQLFDGKLFEVIEQAEGNDDWSDILELILALNSSEAIATEYLQEHFKVNNLARGWALETAFRNTDASLGTGNNYIFTDTLEGPEVLFDFVAYDFDTALTASEARFAAFLGIPLQQLLALLDAGVTNIGGVETSIFVMNKNPYMAVTRKDKPLAVAAARVPGFNNSFTEAYKQFVSSVIVQFPGRAEAIRQAHHDLVRPIVAQDRMYRISNTASGNSIATFDAAGAASKAWIEERWAYLASMFYVNNHGTCDYLAQCTCNDNYFGATCDDFCGLDFVQTKTGGWNDGASNFTQYQVKLNVGPQPISRVFLEAVYDATSFEPYNLNKVSGSSNVYTLPSWQYSNGAIPANSQSVSFGYTIKSNNPAKFRLQNNACEVPSCALEVTTVEKSSWVSGNTINKQVEFQVRNPTSTPATNVKIQLNFQGGAYVSQSWNIAPATSNANAASEQFTLSLYNLAPGQTSISSGAIITASLNGNPSFSTSVVSGTCL